MLFGLLLKGFLIINPMRYEHVIWVVKTIRPILLIDVYERLNYTSKRKLVSHQVNLSIRGFQREWGSNYIVSWGGN